MGGQAGGDTGAQRRLKDSFLCLAAHSLPLSSYLTTLPLTNLQLGTSYSSSPLWPLVPHSPLFAWLASYATFLLLLAHLPPSLPPSFVTFPPPRYWDYLGWGTTEIIATTSMPCAPECVCCCGVFYECVSVPPLRSLWRLSCEHFTSEELYLCGTSVIDIVTMATAR